MAKPKVVLNMGGINAVLREAQPVVDAAAERMQGAAGPDYEVVSKPHRWTARAFVQTATAKGARDNAKHNTLARALGGQVRG